jgi:hypothetical protein
MNYIGLDVHKKTISYCVKDVSGRIQQEGTVGATRRKIDASKIADSSKRIGSVLFQPKCCHWIDASGSSSRNPNGDQRDCAKKQWCHDKGSGVPSLDSE